jgi:hypothetical protein
MMSKFEMALLTVTVVGTLVAWPALQQDSFVRPADGTTGMSCSVHSSFIAVSVPHVDTMGEMLAILHRPQSSSASRFTPGTSGFLNFSQSGDRPER